MLGLKSPDDANVVLVCVQLNANTLGRSPTQRLVAIRRAVHDALAAHLSGGKGPNTVRIQLLMHNCDKDGAVVAATAGGGGVPRGGGTFASQLAMPKWAVSAAATKGVVDVVGEGRPIFILEQNCNTRETRRVYIDEVRVFIQDVRQKIGGMVEVFSIERASGASDVLRRRTASKIA